jgi:hypothetical protein
VRLRLTVREHSDRTMTKDVVGMFQVVIEVDQDAEEQRAGEG